MELIIILAIIFFSVRYVVRLKKRIHNLEKGSGGQRFIRMEEELKIAREKNRNASWAVNDKVAVERKKYFDLKKQYDKKSEELDKYYSDRKKAYEYSERKFQNQFKLQEDEYKRQVNILETTHKEELEKYRINFLDENNDLIQEYGLKLAREKAKERLTEMERKYNNIIQEMELNYKAQLLNLEQRFANNHQEEIERMASLKAKEYLQDNFPLE